MIVLKALVSILLLPGNLVLAKLKVSQSEDGGILRSMINMLFWGTVSVAFIWPQFM